MGLAGSEDFAVKVSYGTEWCDALRIDQLHRVTTAAQEQIDLVSRIQDEPRQSAHLGKAQFGELGIRAAPGPCRLARVICLAICATPLPTSCREAR